MTADVSLKRIDGLKKFSLVFTEISTANGFVTKNYCTVPLLNPTVQHMILAILAMAITGSIARFQRDPNQRRAKSGGFINFCGYTREKKKTDTARQSRWHLVNRKWEKLSHIRKHVGISIYAIAYFVYAVYMCAHFKYLLHCIMLISVLDRISSLWDIML